jgi:hexosaminidase
MSTDRRFQELVACLLFFCAVLTVSCARRVAPPAVATTAAAVMGGVIPAPFSMVPATGEFTLQARARILVEGQSPEVREIGEYLAARLRSATGFELKIGTANGASAKGNIRLTTAGTDASLGQEGYRLIVSRDRVELSASKPDGLFRGVQTLRQLLPAAIERSIRQAGPWKIPAGTIEDRPRFSWRGAMLDVSRHFFKVEDVKRYIDEIAYYKVNRLHLHLSDDQGWRIEIKSWPRLAAYGGSTQVGGGPGGSYSQAEYSDIVAYARSRYIMVIPEIDMPGHTNAALASYPELNCSGTAPALYAGIQVGFSSLCTEKDVSYKFIDDVIRELAAITPGPFIHIGGDEARSTPEVKYKPFIARVQKIVEAHGKRMIGWGEIAKIDGLSPQSLVQHWTDDAKLPRLAAKAGAKVIMSPATKAYLDMKYTRETKLGQDWAALIEVRDGYSWDPATFISGVTEEQIIGVEAPLWTETMVTLSDLEYMAFPRLPGCAEIGWSPASARNWDEYRQRLASHGPRLEAMGINSYRSPQVPWPQAVAASPVPLRTVRGRPQWSFR